MIKKKNPGQMVEEKDIEKKAVINENWNPRTLIGKQVKSQELTDIDVILDKGMAILEPEIVEILIPELVTELLLVGQAKGKFGGGQRRIFKQTQKITQEGAKPKFTVYALVGNKNGYVGIGSGKAKETVPAREKAIKKAKLNVFKIRRGCGSWACGCKEPHTIPYTVSGKCGSTTVILIPAPKGTGLKVEKECSKVLELAGIKDVWSKVEGQTSTKANLLKACIESLKKLTKVKIQNKHVELLGILDGKKIS